MRAEAYAESAAGNATMVVDGDKAAREREAELQRRLAELEADRDKAAAEVKAAEGRLAQAQADMVGA